MYRTATDRRYEAARYRQLTDEATKIPTVCLALCEYNKARRALTLASEYMGMPREFFVKSHHTGKEVRFTVVTEHDVLFDQDQWDGEQQLYRPVGVVPNVEYMCIYNQY
jgi:hypothetical protein